MVLQRRAIQLFKDVEKLAVIGFFLVEIQAVVVCNLIEPGLKRYRRGIAVNVLIALDEDVLDSVLGLILIVKQELAVYIHLPLKSLNYGAKLLYVSLLNLLDNLLNMVRRWTGRMTGLQKDRLLSSRLYMLYNN
ncbi:hypothetical protein SAMN04488601_10395 [Paenibacillus sp. 453mf]|nr:hypothetical protein SAMN04488601_10395 [Paenibacillus sp. 453mf]